MRTGEKYLEPNDSLAQDHNAMCAKKTEVSLPLGSAIYSHVLRHPELPFRGRWVFLFGFSTEAILGSGFRL